MDGCVFCKIINKELPSNVVYEDDLVLAINDIRPQAPVHVIVFPKEHITGIMELKDNKDLAMGLINAIQKVAEIKDVAKKGFRVINNYGKDGGQTVNHVHFHVLGGKILGETIV